MEPHEEEIVQREEAARSRRMALIGLGVVAGLIVLGWWLGHVLSGVSRIQDYVMAGRRNCVTFH